MKKLFNLQFNCIQDIWSCHTASSYSLGLVVSNKSKKATVEVAPSYGYCRTAQTNDWQEGSTRVRLQSEAFSFSETQDLMRPILKTWFLCTSCASTVLVPMYCKLNAFNTYRHMIICPSALFLPWFFKLGIFIQAGSLKQPLLVAHWPVGAQWYPWSCLLPPPALCTALLPWPWVSQARDTVCFLLQEASQPGLRKWDVSPTILHGGEPTRAGWQQAPVSHLLVCWLIFHNV